MKVGAAARQYGQADGDPMLREIRARLNGRGALLLAVLASLGAAAPARAQTAAGAACLARHYAAYATAQRDYQRTVERVVELRVINKHTMAERTERYIERWRWDPDAKRWWLVVGLPDLWKGQ